MLKTFHSAFIISSALLFCLASISHAQEAPDTAGTAFDLQGFIDGKLAEGKKEIVVPPGRYRVTPNKGHHLRFENLQDVTINANGVEMVCTETTRALTIDKCKNLTIRGLDIDYDPLPFTQGRITAMSPDKLVHDIEIFDGYPGSSGVFKFKYEIFRPDTRTLRTHDYGIESVEKVDDRHLRITKTRGQANDLEEVGDIVVIGNNYTPNGKQTHAVQLTDSVGVRLEDINLYASNCFGFLELRCDGTTYLRCHIDRCPPEKDLYPRASARVRSLDADAYHSKHAVKGPSLIESSAHFMADDAVNICGSYHIITEGSGDTYRMLKKGEGETMFNEGDTLELFTYEGLRLPDTKVIKVVPDTEGLTEKERDFLSKQRMDQGLKTGWKPKAFLITFEHPVALTWFSVVASTHAIGNGFLVKDCHFGFNRSRGILIKASDGEVTGNTVEGSWMAGINVAPEYWWLEAGCSNNLVIQNNTIRNVRGTAISIDAMAGNGQTAPAGAHHNITITGNTVTDSPLPQIHVSSTQGLKLEDNHLTPFVSEPKEKEHPSVQLTNCENVTQK